MAPVNNGGTLRDSSKVLRDIPVIVLEGGHTLPFAPGEKGPGFLFRGRRDDDGPHEIVIRDSLKKEQRHSIAPARPCRAYLPGGRLLWPHRATGTPGGGEARAPPPPHPNNQTQHTPPPAPTPTAPS